MKNFKRLLFTITSYLPLLFFSFSYFKSPGDVIENFDSWSDGTYGTISTYTDPSGGQWETYNSMCHATNARSGKAIRFNYNSGANEYLLYKGIDGNGKDNGLGSISFWYRHWDEDGSAIRFLVQYNQNEEGWTTIGDTILAVSATFLNFSEPVNLNGNNILFRIISIEDAERLIIDDLIIEDYLFGPAISVSENQLDSFFYIEGNGPSEIRSFTVSGNNLAYGITITPPSSFEISSDGITFQSSAIFINESGGTVDPTAIYTRLQSGLVQQTYHDTISCSSEGASNESVSCNGRVFPEAFSALVINEADSDTRGTDRDEFIELFDGGTGNTPLDGLVVVLYNGDGDISYATYDLDGFLTCNEGYFVLGSSRVPHVGYVAWSTNGMQNGADAVALYIGDASGFPNGTGCTTEHLIDALVYDTDDADDEGLLALLNVSQPQINENETGNVSNYSVQRIGDGSGGQRNTEHFHTAIPTPGAKNFDAVWVGNTDNNWATASNWFPSTGKPESMHSVFIPGNCAFSPDILSSETIDQITLDFDAQLNGQENLTANIVQTIHQVTYSTSGIQLDRWQLFSSPFSDLTPAEMISSNNRIDLWIGAYNNSCSSDIHRSWEYNLTPQGLLEPVKGYILTATYDESEDGESIYDNDYYLTIEGTLNNASSSSDFILTCDSSGWNLAGNPYLAPVDWFDNVHITYGNIQGNAAYLYDPATGSYVTLAGNGAGSGIVTPSKYTQYIAPMQGFFVEALSEGFLEIAPGSRSDQNVSFLKSTRSENSIFIKVSCDSVWDETVVTLNPEASNEFDRYDAHKLFALNRNIPQVFTIASDNHFLAVNQLSETPTMIPVRIITEKTGNLEVEFTFGENFSYSLNIEHSSEGIIQKREIVSGEKFVLQKKEAAQHIDFFLLIDEIPSVTGQKKVHPVNINLTQAGLHYKNLPQGKGLITIWNSSGKKVGVFETKNTEGFYELNISRGLYILQYRNAQIQYTKKSTITH